MRRNVGGDAPRRALRPLLSLAGYVVYVARARSATSAGEGWGQGPPEITQMNAAKIIVRMWAIRCGKLSFWLDRGQGALERSPGRGAMGVSRQGPRAGIYVVLAAEMERRAHWASYLSPQLHCHVRGAHQADCMSALLPAHMGELCGVHRVIRIRVLCST